MMIMMRIEFKMEGEMGLLRAVVFCLLSLQQMTVMAHNGGSWRGSYHGGGGESTTDREAASETAYNSAAQTLLDTSRAATFDSALRGTKSEDKPGFGGGFEQTPFRSMSVPSIHTEYVHHPVRHYTKLDTAPRRYPLGAQLTKRDLDLESSQVPSVDHAAIAAAKSEQMKPLKELARIDPVSAVLEHIRIIESERNCSHNTPLMKHVENITQSNAYQQFEPQMRTAIKTANVLNNLFRTWDPDSASNPIYNDDFYFSLVRAMVENDDVVSGGSIAFEMGQYNNRDFCPSVYIRKGKMKALDLAQQSRGRCAGNSSTDGQEWFLKVREKNFSDILWSHKRTCRELKHKSAAERANTSGPVTTAKEGRWTTPYYDCKGGKAWTVTYSVPFFGCISEETLQFKGVVAINFNLARIDINQCKADGTLFSGTHRCRETTECNHIPNKGFRRGMYECVCAKGYYFPRSERTKNPRGLYSGADVEVSYLNKLLNVSTEYDDRFQCIACKEGCEVCTGEDPCMVEYDVLIRGVPLGIQSFCMTITLVLGLVIMKIRKSKVMKASMWVMLEAVLLGALMSYATVIIQYFEPTTLTCLLMPWFRELGFAIIYGALILKVYRVLAEFQSRKAHRVHVRDRDLLKYLLGIVLVVIGYMSAWTAINMDHVHDGDSMIARGKARVGEDSYLEYHICQSFWWDYVIEVGEFLFLCFGIYLCYCVRSAPSDYSETRYISWAVYNETVISALLHIIRHFIWLTIHPDYIFLMYFLRCQLTVTVTLILVLGPKLWYAHRPPEDDHFRSRAYSSSDVHDTILPESMKLHVGVSSNGDVDVGEVNLSEMDPEDIRAELKRLYTQLQIYKTKTMRKDNPHIPKRRGGRKQTHRRFSLQAFHYKHRHHHDHDHDHELSKTPEESTNSAEGVAIQMEGSSCGGEERTPTVTFKPGHKSFS